MNSIAKKDLAYIIFETDYGTVNTLENRDIHVLSIEGISSVSTSIETSSNPYTPGEIVVGSHQNSRIITLEMTAPNIYRAQMIRQFATGRAGRLTVNWGGCMRYIHYIVHDASIVQETIASNLRIDMTLFCPDVYFNDMNDFGENIAAEVPLITFPNLWYIDDGLVTDYKRFESAVALENSGDVPIGMRFVITAAKGSVLNPVIYLSESVYFRVFVQMKANDILEISTVRREKCVRLNGENILNKTDMGSTFFEITPGIHKVYYGAHDGMENMDIYLYRRPQYLGV